MVKRIWPVRIEVALLLLPVIFVTDLPMAAACDKLPKSYSAERLKVQQLLAAKQFTGPEQHFLIGGTDRLVREIRGDDLSRSGQECGIDRVRASILSCIVHVLPGTLRDLKSDAKMTGKSFWGKPDVSRREAAFIGIFHACRGGAVDLFRR